MVFLWFQKYIGAWIRRKVLDGKHALFPVQAICLVMVPDIVHSKSLNGGKCGGDRKINLYTEFFHIFE
jgi:hypothetical protein